MGGRRACIFGWRRPRYGRFLTSLASRAACRSRGRAFEMPILCQAGNQMQEESIVICPFCETEQQPSLLFEGAPAAVGILYSFISKPHKTLWATWKSFKAVTFENVSMTPALKCNHCRNGFVHCPHCSSTTLLTDVEIGGQLVNCSDCKIRLEVSDV